MCVTWGLMGNHFDNHWMKRVKRESSISREKASVRIRKWFQEIGVAYLSETLKLINF